MVDGLRGMSRLGMSFVTHRSIRRSSTLAILAGAIALGGCGLSTLTQGLGGGGSGIFGGGSSAKVNDDELLAAARGEATATGSLGEISASCPQIVLPSRDNNVTIYETGRAGDALAVMHRGELTKTARECTVEGNRVTVKYGFSGRVLLGPKGKNGNITLPVRIALTDAKREAMKAEAVRVDTAVSVDKPIGYFSAVRTVTFDIPVGSRPGEFEINVSFDRNIPGAG
jgi:hypothetical protein